MNMTKGTSTILAKLRRAVEGKTEYSDGTIWGEVYLKNVGSSHALAGHLSALKKEGYYRPVADCFGEVRLTD